MAKKSTKQPKNKIIKNQRLWQQKMCPYFSSLSKSIQNSQIITPFPPLWPTLKTPPPHFHILQQMQNQNHIVILLPSFSLLFVSLNNKNETNPIPQISISTNPIHIHHLHTHYLLTQKKKPRKKPAFWNRGPRIREHY